MPSRLTIIAILLFWLGTSAWLFQREIWPRLEPGLVPPFALYETDDSQPVQVPVRWTAALMGLKNDTRLFIITTSVTHNDKNKEDEFVLSAKLKPKNKEAAASAPFGLKALLLDRVETSYRVHGKRMLGFTAKVIHSLGLIEEVADYSGEVENQICTLRWQKTIEGKFGDGRTDLEVSRTGTVMMPLHPLDRIEGLQAGRRWGLHLFDPLDRASASVPTAPPRLVWVKAEVRERPELLNWHAKDRLCWVIEYSGDAGEVRGSTWVDVEDGRVFKMTMHLGAQDSWEIVRE